MDSNILVIADAAGIIRFWSAGAEKAFGHASPETFGQSLDLIVPPDYRAAHWKGFHATMASGTAAVEGQALPFPVLHASGEISPMTGRLSLLRAPDGAVIAAAVLFAQPS